MKKKNINLQKATDPSACPIQFQSFHDVISGTSFIQKVKTPTSWHRIIETSWRVIE
jgi:hypothetical protein